MRRHRIDEIGMKKRAMRDNFLLLLMLTMGCAQSRAISQKDSGAIARQTMAELTEGTRLLNQKKYSDAETHFRRALRLDPYSGLAHNNLGTIYYEQGNLYDAAGEFQSAAKLLPSRPEPRNNLGLTLEAGEKLDDAMVEYQKAVDFDPENPQYLGNLVRAHIRRGDRDSQTRELLGRLLEKESRPEWRLWAQRELASLSSRATE
jgi:Flp pilus assembly protein TadD